MPLSYEERRRLNDCLNGMSAPAVMGDTDGSAGNGSGIDRLCNALARVCDILAPIMERAAETEDGQPPATDAPRRRGRKPATGADGAAAAPQSPGATAPTSAPVPAAQSVAQAAPTQTTPAPKDADLGGFAADPLDEGTPGNGEAMPAFLDRSKPAAAPAPAPKVYSAQEVKDVLKKYMDKKGPSGTQDLTNLLVAVGGVKKFAELAPEKYGEIITRAKVDAGLQ